MRNSVSHMDRYREGSQVADKEMESIQASGNDRWNDLFVWHRGTLNLNSEVTCSFEMSGCIFDRTTVQTIIAMKIPELFLSHY